MAADFATLDKAVAARGLTLRGGFATGEGNPACITLIGNVGREMWAAFAADRRDEPDSLDSWTRRMVDPLAARFGARAVYPNDRPYHPFQRWAQQAEAVHASPLGILIHPVHGLWHAYRAALLFPAVLEGLPGRRDTPSPCDSCAGKPCLTACPVGAFDGSSYDVTACAGHLRTGCPPGCATIGCRARDACPVARDGRYPHEQITFHMEAFVKSRGGPWPR